MRLDPQLRQALAHIRAAGEATWYVLTAYILHANTRGRAWPSIDTLSRETGYSRPSIVAARAWLVEHGALSRVGHALRVDAERAHPQADVMQVSGVIEVDGRVFRTVVPAEDRSAAPTASSQPGLLLDVQQSTALTPSSQRALPEGTAATAAAAALDQGDGRPGQAARPIFAVWEQEARQPLTPVLADILGEMVDRFGEAQVAEGLREAIRTTGPGKFSVKYVLRILERWELEAANGITPDPRNGGDQRERKHRRSAPRGERRPGRIRPDFSAGRRHV